MAKKQAMKVMKVLGRTKKFKKMTKSSLNAAMIAELKSKSGRKDLKFQNAPEVAARQMKKVPITERPGYPFSFPKGSVDPRNWITEHGVKVEVAMSRPAWLPDSWGVGIKITKPTIHSFGGGGGTYTVLVAPDGKIFYHRPPAEEHFGRQFTLEDGFSGQVRTAKQQAEQTLELVRAQIREAKKGGKQGIDVDAALFKDLTPAERKLLPAAKDFHFAVVSARRATSVSGLSDIFAVQSQLVEAGVTPTWYVDAASLESYQKVGLQAKVGGKLTPARNMALDDAAKAGKICVQCSDDISAWEYRAGKAATVRTDDALNAAHAAATRIIASPVACARFIVAKMRGAPEATKPKLGGVYMLGSCSRTFIGSPFVRSNFILGDFFVVDKGSKVRFDESMTLKEDYDFTCAHIKAHGSVMRCNRMTLSVKHYANAGGACSNRDSKGVEERKNIDILMRKYPGCFRANPKRKNEVILKWRGGGKGQDDEEDDEQEEAGEKASIPKIKKIKKHLLKKKVKTAVRNWKGLPSPRAVLSTTSKVANKHYITRRCKRVAGLTVEKALAARVADSSGSQRAYSVSDLRYDLKSGFLQSK